MAIGDAILPDFDHEMKLTRKTLERVPEDRASRKPHEKSMSMSPLAGHAADVPGYAVLALAKKYFGFETDGSISQPTFMTSRKQILGGFDKDVAQPALQFPPCPTTD